MELSPSQGLPLVGIQSFYPKEAEKGNGNPAVSYPELGASEMLEKGMRPEAASALSQILSVQYFSSNP